MPSKTITRPVPNLGGKMDGKQLCWVSGDAKKSPFNSREELWCKSKSGKHF
jgi:hypothetical protein